MFTVRFGKKSGDVDKVDLDAVVDVVKGPSGRRPAWSALIVYEPSTDLFIELRDSPNDCAHGTPDEREEVDAEYVKKYFGLTDKDLAQLKEHPKHWRLKSFSSRLLR